MKHFTFHVKKIWFDKIWDGEKIVEYREIKPYWASVFLRYGQKFNATFAYKYSSKGKMIDVKVYKVDVGRCPYKCWNDKYFRVHFKVVRKKTIK